MKLGSFLRNEDSYLDTQTVLKTIKTYPKSFAFLASFIAAYVTIDLQQKNVNDYRDSMDHAFSISEMDEQEKIRNILGTNVYGSKIGQHLGIGQNIPQTGLIHLYGSEMQSIEEAKSFIDEVSSSSVPYIFSADVEGGWVQHINVTQDELRNFGFPEEMIDFRRQELEFYFGDNVEKIEEKIISHPTPSQEWLGRIYSDLQTDEERKDFLILVSKYGEAMAKLCDHIGINVMFGPVLDRVADIDGESPMEIQDRSFSNDYNVIRDLSIAYLSGVNKVDSVIAVPKHFVGNGVSITDPHYDSSSTNIDPKLGTAILPFRDIINFDNDLDPQGARYQRYIEQLSAANVGHIERQNQASTQAEKDKIQLSIDANNERIAINMQYLKDSELGFLRSIFKEGINVPIIMTSNVSTNLYNDSQTPTMFSQSALNALSRPKSQDGLGFEGITITDDVSMSSSHDYIKSQIPYFSSYDVNALAAYAAIASGNELVLMRHITGKEDYIASEIARYIEEGVDLNQDGKADVAQEQLDIVLQKVLDLKVELGVLSSMEIRGETFYVLNPNIHKTSELSVLRDSFFSNQWPWLVKDEYYNALGRDNDQSAAKLLYKAVKNFGITLYSTILNDPLGRLDNPRYPESDESNQKELIIVDKSARYLWRYDLETRELIESFEIGIGKGGEGPRRVIGDHRTPAGNYQIVQKRDAQWWEENKGVPLPEYYGGDDGGMLVMTGQWTPEIAIHGGGGLGFVSNACIRVEDPVIQKLMREVPLKSMVIITN